ncbi:MULTISPECIES: restriction endonuclease subunit S [unclassified Thioalkalivibrio]|uniref:restriction endonuclease subunit S n=1 Tax=unclassified Thioalkalivibrio TaxID=2621013 RepID=UPI0003641F5B|nr:MULTISPECIES: restriction endonuclease subunit S [unclassified Thioalkalivibrio]
MSDYQQLLAELPSDWSTLPINEVGEVISGGTPSRNNPSYWGGGIPWVTPSEVTGLAQKHLEYTEEKITTEGLAQSGAKLLPVNSLLITTRASLGAAALNSVPATTNQGFKSIAFGNHFSPHYYYHWSAKLKSELVRLASGTTFLEISGSEFRKVSVPVPPWTEQTHIARILDTVDTQIQKTEALIAKLEKVKEGLLHDLLTRGIDENGQLRPSPEQAPELYKDSPLGLIPREWVCDQLKWFVPTADYGISSSLSDSGEVPVLRMNNFQDGEASLGSLKFSPASSISGLTLQYGDVLFNRTNSIDHVGRTGIWRGQLPRVSFASYLVRLNPDQEKLSPEYLNFWLNLNSTKNMVKRYATPGVHQVNVNPTNLRKVYMAAPSSIREQLKVVDALLGLNKKINKEQHAAAKLKSEKTALMDDLLTGRVRVTPLLEQGQPTTSA